jgi:hypothetical protein
MKEALEQVVDLSPVQAIRPNECKGLKGIHHLKKMACSTGTVQVCL